MSKQMKYLVLVMILGIFSMGLTTTNAADTITSRVYDCDSLDGVSYMGSTWPQARTANLLAGQKLSIDIYGPHAQADVTINGVLIANNVDVDPAATVKYIVPANDTYTIVIEVLGGDPGDNFTIHCTSDPDSYRTA